MMLYLLNRADGGVSIMRVLKQTSIEREIAEWQAATNLQCIGYRTITEAEVPTDRTLRGAWSYDGNAITVTLARAKRCAELLDLPAQAIANATTVAAVRNLVRAELDRKTAQGRSRSMFRAM